MINKTVEPVGKYISQLYRKGRSFITKELSEYEIGSGQIMFLLQLYNQDGISQEELTEKLNIDKGTTCRAIKKLEEENFLTREKDEKDKRAYKVCLTDKSKEMKESVYSVLKEWDMMMLANLSDEERETFISILKKICINQNIK